METEVDSLMRGADSGPGAGLGWAGRRSAETLGDAGTADGTWPPPSQSATPGTEHQGGQSTHPRLTWADSLRSKSECRVRAPSRGIRETPAQGSVAAGALAGASDVRGRTGTLGPASSESARCPLLPRLLLRQSADASTHRSEQLSWAVSSLSRFPLQEG